MSLATYTELQASVARWLRRSDLGAEIPDFITNTEAQFNRRLRVRKMIGRATATISDEFSALPADFAGVRSFIITSPKSDLQYVTPDQMDRLWLTEEPVGGPPTCYTVVGDEFQFFPAPTSGSWTARLTYYKRVTPLSDAAPTNWMLAQNPDIYLYGALLQSAPYLKADDRIQTWSTLYLAALEDLDRADTFEETGATLVPIPSGVV
ncbi:phage adaptor protein [Caulobacter sp. NIBR2454]|uniref:phage adaptor protein n=1 Tax=Caulobacter sp. NIBR2454 TaxID=3015996 RepID=UPI0022B6EBE3|nr:hypothetical protein [Caulobacter sp. NIBR2454]